MQIEEDIRESFAEGDISAFWPEHFVDAGYGTLDEVLLALRDLVGEGKIDVVAEVHCPEGHLSWEGSPAELADLWVPICPDCGEEIGAIDNLTSLIFVLNSEWQARLSGSSQKKRSISYSE